MALIYFIPGTMCDWAVWSKLWEKLPSEHDLRHVVLPSMGATTEVVDELVEYIRKDSAGKSFNLIGFSMGGYLAAAISLSFDQQLLRLMIIANTPKSLPDVELLAREKILLNIEKHGYNGLNTVRVKSFLNSGSHSDTELISLIKAMDGRFSRSDLSHHLKQLSIRADLCDLLTKTNRPTWFCYGVTDSLVDRKVMQQMQVISPDITIKQVLNCGHFLPLEQPQQLAQYIQNWLEMIEIREDKNVIIGLIDPKSPSNVGAVMRAAGCYSADAVYYTGLRYDRAARFNTDTKQMTDKIPLENVEDFVSLKTHKRKLICVDLIEGAIPLPEFEHPEQAVYVFGPEDSSVNQALVDAADAVVYMPTKGCMNLAASVNVLLYDRAAKSSATRLGDELIRSSRDINNNVKVKNS